MPEASETVFRFADELGPAKVLHVYEPALDLRGIVVVDNAAAGPSIGGVRMAPDVSLAECFRLARAMTLKNAAASLPHGGGKAVVFGDPAMPPDRKERLMRAFAVAIRDVTDYIAGPDMGTNETVMAWLHDEIGRSVGLPAEVGGIPLDEIGATGWGLTAAARIACPVAGLELKGARIAVQGFGAVGKHAARFLAAEGAVLVAASDSHGMVADPDGLDVAALIALKAEGRSVADLTAGRKGAPDDIVDVDCDIWIPAARPDVIREDNAERFRARMILEGANIPATEAAEEALRARGVLVVPDFIANSGGVTCAAVEYAGGTEATAFQVIAEKIAANTRLVLEAAQAEGVSPRRAAVALAEKRVRAAMGYGRWAGAS
ncbi:MAG: Glu/Leu/Phe/Val dehydrogenase [Alphaproteobacteria bacterium]|nr:Glu/Leu/Phe/Val dehydrogenase [Alphaproteobacteria bacterium]